MSDNNVSFRDVFANRKILIGIVAALLIVVIWVAAFFLPEGTKLSKLNVQEQSLQAKVTAGTRRWLR